MNSDRTMLVFHLAGREVAILAESVYRIVPMARLARPPGLPAVLEGILNLEGTSIPVLRLERLLEMQVAKPGLFSVLLILKAPSNEFLALLVDRVIEVRSAPASQWLSVRPEDSLNACVEAAILSGSRTIHLLSTWRILLEKERRILSDFDVAIKNRMDIWETRVP